MEQKHIRDYNNQEFTVEEAAAWLKELNDRTRSSQSGYNAIDELATKTKALENARSDDYNAPDAPASSLKIATSRALRRLKDFLSGLIDRKVNKAGDTMTGVLNMGGNKIDNVAAGVDSNDAANKGQLDAHTTRIDNPHGVTKAQVGLGNLPNAKSDDHTEPDTAASSLKLATSRAVRRLKDHLVGLIHRKAEANHSHSWGSVTGKPNNFPPANHTHDDRYYTESEVDTKLEGKASTAHTHDDRYYTESEIDAQFEGESGGKKQVHWDRVTGKPNHLGSQTPEKVLAPYVQPTDYRYRYSTADRTLTIYFYAHNFDRYSNFIGYRHPDTSQTVGGLEIMNIRVDAIESGRIRFAATLRIRRNFSSGVYKFIPRNRYYGGDTRDQETISNRLTIYIDSNNIRLIPKPSSTTQANRQVGDYENNYLNFNADSNAGFERYVLGVGSVDLRGVRNWSRKAAFGALPNHRDFDLNFTLGFNPTDDEFMIGIDNRALNAYPTPEDTFFNERDNIYLYVRRNQLESYFIKNNRTYLNRSVSSQDVFKVSYSHASRTFQIFINGSRIATTSALSSAFNASTKNVQILTYHRAILSNLNVTYPA